MTTIRGQKIEHLTSAIADLEDATKHITNYSLLFEDIGYNRIQIASMLIGPIFTALIEANHQRDMLMSIDD